MTPPNNYVTTHTMLSSVRIRLASILVSGLLFLVACGGDDGAPETCTVGALYCVDGAVHQCADEQGTTALITECSEGLQCIDGVCTGFDLSDTAVAQDKGGLPDPGNPPFTDPGKPSEDDRPPTDLLPEDLGSEPVDVVDEETTVDDGVAGAPDLPLDVAFPDTSAPADVVATDLGPVPVTPYNFVDYTLLPNLILQDDIVDITYVPDQPGVAFVLSRHQLARVGPETTVELLVDFDDIYMERVAFAPGFAGALIIGHSGTDGRLYRMDAESGVSAELSGSPIAGVLFYAVVADADQGFYVFGRKSGNENLTYVYRVKEGAEPGEPESVTLTKAFNASAGLTDAIGASSPNILFGTPFVITAHGWNGADSKSFIPETGNVVDNGWSPGFGNAGRGAWQPNGSFGMIAGTSSNKVYIYDGSWEMTALPTIGTAATPNAVAFSPSGNLAMIVGRAIGNPLQGTAVVYENTGPGASNGTYQDWSIPGFGSPPYNANSSTHLLCVAFDPTSICGRGLIGATVPNNQGFALLIGFNTAPCL